MSKTNILLIAYEQNKSTQEVINDLHKEGAVARVSGRKMDDCPYRGSPELVSAWKRGYSNAGLGDIIRA